MSLIWSYVWILENVYWTMSLTMAIKTIFLLLALAHCILQEVVSGAMLMVFQAVLVAGYDTLQRVHNRKNGPWAATDVSQLYWLPFFSCWLDKALWSRSELEVRRLRGKIQDTNVRVVYVKTVVCMYESPLASSKTVDKDLKKELLGYQGFVGLYWLVGQGKLIVSLTIIRLIMGKHPLFKYIVPVVRRIKKRWELYLYFLIHLMEKVYKCSLSEHLKMMTSNLNELDFYPSPFTFCNSKGGHTAFIRVGPLSEPVKLESKVQLLSTPLCKCITFLRQFHW